MTTAENMGGWTVRNVSDANSAKTQVFEFDFITDDQASRVRAVLVPGEMMCITLSACCGTRYVFDSNREDLFCYGCGVKIQTQPLVWTQEPDTSNLSLLQEVFEQSLDLYTDPLAGTLLARDGVEGVLLLATLIGEARHFYRAETFRYVEDVQVKVQDLLNALRGLV